MTIDETTAAAYESDLGYESVPGYDLAMTEARDAGDAGPIDGFVERMAERVGAKASVRAVFGDPIERNGITIIPVAKVRWGFGGGAGGPIAVGPGRGTGSPFSDGAEALDAEAASAGTGSGGGGGVAADPVGYLEIGPNGATFRAIASPMPSPAFLLAAGATAALVLRALAKLLRR